MKILRKVKKQAIAEKLAVSQALADGAAGIPALAAHPTLAALIAAAADLAAAATAAADCANAARAATVLQNQKEDGWDVGLERWLNLLESEPTVTVAMLSAMNLQPTKTKRVATLELTEPLQFQLTMGAQHAALDGRWRAVPGARGYFLELTETPDDPASWRQVATATRTSCTLHGLTTGTTYYGRVRAFGSAGPSPYSTVEMAVAP